MTKRVLLHSIGDVGSTMSGPGIRYYELAKALAGQFDVTLAVPNESDAVLGGVRIVTTPRDPAALRRMLGAFDAVVSQNLPADAMRWLARRPVRVVYDLYVPLLSEHLAMLDVEFDHPASVRFHEQAMLAQRLALLTGNAFVCASERQRDFWLGMLASLGRLDLEVYDRDPSLRQLIGVVPFGMPAERPLPAKPVLKGVVSGIRARDHVLLWGGGVWNWFDPLTVINAVEAVSLRRDDVKLVFLGLRHPQVPQMAMAGRALELARTRGLLGRVVFANENWTAYAERAQYLLEADIGVSAHFDTLETRYAFRTRILDYLWAGLPTITTGGDVLGDLVEQHGLGRALVAGDASGWARAIEELLDQKKAGRARTAIEQVRSDYEWPRVAQTLAKLLAVDGEVVDGRLRQLGLRLDEHTLRLRTSLEIRGPGGFVAASASKATRRLARAARIPRR